MMSTVAQAERRIALVIGNSSYRNTAALANPVNDARDIAAALENVGFTVLLEHDLDKRGMEDAVARFARLAQDADVALFFYAGHGMQYRGSNYLVPVDAKLEDEFKLTFELNHLDDILFGLERARGIKILILDACRDNPLADRLTLVAKSRDFTSMHGLAKIEASRGMVIAYSTQANQVAIDGNGRNSPFTAALVREIDEPGVEIGTLFRRVAADVNALTGGRQLPELSVSLIGDFYLNNRDTDIQTWAKLRGSTDASRLKDFIRLYPKSPLLADVQERLAALDRAEQARIEQAEQDKIEKEKLAREQAERERPEKERLALQQIEREAERERLAREAEERERLAREQALHEQAEPKNPEREPQKPPQPPAVQQRRPLNPAPAPQVAALAAPAQPVEPEVPSVPRPGGAAIDKSPLTKLPKADEPIQSRFNGTWTISWRSTINCSSASGTYPIQVEKRSITGTRKAGTISPSGSVHWNSINPRGNHVSYNGVFRGSSGSGRFQNETGCQGTFTANRN